jgi:N-alpha-acetyltransferase 35, NatC auxiliary subunit
MDSGFLEEGENLEDDFDFSHPLTSEQVLWLMDELVCREVGFSLSTSSSNAEGTR